MKNSIRRGPRGAAEVLNTQDLQGRHSVPEWLTPRDGKYGNRTQVCTWREEATRKTPAVIPRLLLPAPVRIEASKSLSGNSGSRESGLRRDNPIEMFQSTWNAEISLCWQWYPEIGYDTRFLLSRGRTLSARLSGVSDCGDANY